ncbi:hypothetical protein [Sphaerisporangium sp. TRM90804]|uniref:hypothetical protein n=1 Tax=Sphaerisporangium sp. TRM90804 TaxID=3031113 RepID=UPI00244A71EF|nr:hypothetical protein [Sphaerisporangium sp. TRM90804]MDH2428983.1 hypothetical protein [Sphaerisporangium sp. TRM90804]
MVDVELTIPTDAVTDQPMTIGWRGTYAQGAGLRAPAAGLPTGTKLYAYASISGLPALTSATGVGELLPVEAGEIIPLPLDSVPMRTTSRNAGRASVKAAAMNFGSRPNEPFIECDVQNPGALTTHPLTVTAAGQTPDPTPSTPTPTPSSPTPTPRTPAPTVTATVTASETFSTVSGGVLKTPSGGADTGGGGTTGPDGRALVAAGSLLLCAAATGLRLRRRGLSKR